MSGREELGDKLNLACMRDMTAEAKRQNRNGRAPLHIASRDGQTEIVMLLLENKCNLNVTDNDGNTPFMYAAWNNKLDTVRALVEAGCDITIRGENNMTAAEWADQHGYNDIAEYLATEGPRVQRFILHPSSDGDRKRRPKHAGAATRAILRDIYSTGRLPIGPCSLIQKFGGKQLSLGEMICYESGSA